MLLSIDRVLQLLAEGKSISKISELADCSEHDVTAVIEEARELLQKHEKAISKRKIIIKKNKHDDNTVANTNNVMDKDVNFLQGAELSAVPMGSQLIIYTDGASLGNPGPAGIGIVIYDMDDRQVGKVSTSIGTRTNNYAEYTAIIRALKIAHYFQAHEVKIRTDSELVVKQVNGEYQVKNENIKPLYSELKNVIKRIPKVKIEHVTRNLNDKADYLAKKGAAAHRRSR